MICYECIINHNKPISIHDNIDCSVCYENNKGIELSKCNHIICVDCYKNIYFGFINHNVLTKPSKRESIFSINNLLHDCLGNYDFSQPLNNLLDQTEIDINIKTKEFIDYETSFIIHCKSQYDLDLQDIEYYNNKFRNITNMRCPLCRQ